MCVWVTEVVCITFGCGRRYPAAATVAVCAYDSPSLFVYVDFHPLDLVIFVRAPTIADGWLASLVNGHVNIHYYYFSVATRYFWFFLLSACCVAVRMKSQMKQHNTTIHPYNVWCCCTATTTKYHPISLKCSTAFYYSTLYVYVLNWFHTEASCTNCAKKTVKNHV